MPPWHSGTCVPDATPELWELARHVDGWGRIQIVERLVPTEDPALRHWLRTEGFRDGVMYEYLALIAAEYGRLFEALEVPALPPEELQAAGEIIRAMIAGGPAPGLRRMKTPPGTCLHFLRHAASTTAMLTNFLTAHSILGYLERDQRAGAERLSCGSDRSLDRFGASVRALADRPTRVGRTDSSRIAVTRSRPVLERQAGGQKN